jgi:hypothetical protein
MPWRSADGSWDAWSGEDIKPMQIARRRLAQWATLAALLAASCQPAASGKAGSGGTSDASTLATKMADEAARATPQATPVPLPLTTVGFAPARRSAQASQRFDLDVVIAAGAPTRGAQFGLRYDPALLQIDGVAEGSFYRSWAEQYGGRTLPGRLRAAQRRRRRRHWRHGHPWRTVGRRAFRIGRAGHRQPDGQARCEWLRCAGLD